VDSVFLLSLTGGVVAGGGVSCAKAPGETTLAATTARLVETSKRAQGGNAAQRVGGFFGFMLGVSGLVHDSGSRVAAVVAQIFLAGVSPGNLFISRHWLHRKLNGIPVATLYVNCGSRIAIPGLLFPPGTRANRVR